MKYVFKYVLGGTWYLLMFAVIASFFPIVVVVYTIWEFKFPQWSDLLEHSCYRYDIPGWHWFLSNKADYSRGESGVDTLIFKSYYHYIIGEVKQVKPWPY